jgi:hypothetical protein
MIQALKEAFMGYIGLLLNAPYKIDSMVWMRLMMIVFVFSWLFCSLLRCWGYTNQGVFWDASRKIGVTRVLGVYRPFIECPLQDR